MLVSRLLQLRTFNKLLSVGGHELGTAGCNGKRKLKLTLGIIKPDATANPYVVKDLIIANEFYVVRTKRLTLSLADSELFYACHKDKFFYNRLTTFMSRAHHEDPESIRGKFGLSDTRNVTHGSDSVESAVAEIKFFFPEFNIESWYQNEEEHFQPDSVSFDKNKFQHSIHLKSI